MIPTRTVETIDRYVQKRVRPGGFVQAVLENNLMGAFNSADDENREALFDIVCYIWNKIPAKCCGSPERVKDWLADKQEPKDSIGE